MKIGNNKCSKSKRTQWPCIYDLLYHKRIDNETVHYLYRCKRCREMHKETVKLENPKCLISPTGNHIWNFSHNISFRQRWKYQEICDSQSCESCTTTREVSYVRMIGYSPHR